MILDDKTGSALIAYLVERAKADASVSSNSGVRQTAQNFLVAMGVKK